MDTSSAQLSTNEESPANMTQITKTLSNRKEFSSVMPSKDLNSEPIISTNQLLATWNEFLTKKFASPDSDMNRSREHTVSNEDTLSDEELDKALFSMKTGKAPGWDEIPAEVYQNSKTARSELYLTYHI